MPDTDRSIYKGGVGEIVEKKSRFIATVQPVSTKEEAEEMIAACKKKYWDARHNCSAYIITDTVDIMHSQMMENRPRQPESRCSTFWFRRDFAMSASW